MVKDVYNTLKFLVQPRICNLESLVKVNGEMKTSDIYNDNDACRLDAMT